MAPRILFEHLVPDFTAGLNCQKSLSIELIKVVVVESHL